MKKKQGIEIQLSPYPGTLLVAPTKDAYEKKHIELFDEEDPLNSAQTGRFCGRRSVNGDWICLVWAKNQNSLVHELSHVVLDTFDMVGIDPIASGGEPFCYMLCHLLACCK